MCQKKENSRKIDECLVDKIAEINKIEGLKTILSCCGHGIYQPSIIILDKNEKFIFEYFSGMELKMRCKNGRIRHRYYKKDSQGFYFIPELESRSKVMLPMNLEDNFKS